MSTRINQTIWRTKVDDRVLCSRFTNDGHHFLIGTGGTSSLSPLILFDSERAQPLHVSRWRLMCTLRGMFDLCRFIMQTIDLVLVFDVSNGFHRMSSSLLALILNSKNSIFEQAYVIIHSAMNSPMIIVH